MSAHFTPSDTLGTVFSPSVSTVGACTFTARARIDSIAASNQVLACMDGTGGSLIQFELDTVGPHWLATMTNDAFAFTTVTSSVVTVVNVWVHLAMTWDLTTLTMYENGVQVGSVTPGALTRTGTWADFACSQNFGGSVQDVCAYNAVLSLAEIQQLVRQRLPARRANLIEHIPMITFGAAAGTDYSGVGQSLTSVFSGSLPTVGDDSAGIPWGTPQQQQQLRLTPSSGAAISGTEVETGTLVAAAQMLAPGEHSSIFGSWNPIASYASSPLALTAAVGATANLSAGGVGTGGLGGTTAMSGGGAETAGEVASANLSGSLAETGGMTTGGVAALSGSSVQTASMLAAAALSGTVVETGAMSAGAAPQSISGTVVETGGAVAAAALGGSAVLTGSMSAGAPPASISGTLIETGALGAVGALAGATAETAFELGAAGLNGSGVQSGAMPGGGTLSGTSTHTASLRAVAGLQGTVVETGTMAASSSFPPQTIDGEIVQTARMVPVGSLATNQAQTAQATAAAQLSASITEFGFMLRSGGGGGGVVVNGVGRTRRPLFIISRRGVRAR